MGRLGLDSFGSQGSMLQGLKMFDALRFCPI